MVEPLARGETVRVTIGGVRERSAHCQRRQAMLGTEMPAKATAMKARLSSHKNSTQAECPPAINQAGEVPFSLCAGAIGVAVSTSTHRRCNRRRHDECS